MVGLKHNFLLNILVLPKKSNYFSPAPIVTATVQQPQQPIAQIPPAVQMQNQQQFVQQPQPQPQQQAQPQPQQQQMQQPIQQQVPNSLNLVTTTTSMAPITSKNILFRLKTLYLMINI